MAIAFTNLGASANPDINSNTDAVSYSNTSSTPPSAGLLFAFIYNRGNAVPATTPTLSGWGLTYTQIQTSIRSNDQLTLIAANLAGSSTGVLTVDYGGVTQLNCCMSLFYATGVDLSGGVAAAFVQAPAGGGAPATSGSISLSAAGHTDNRPISAFFHGTNEAVTERASWTEVDEFTGTGPTRGMNSQYRSDAFETTASASWATSTAWCGIAAELKALQAGGKAPPIRVRPLRIWKKVS